MRAAPAPVALPVPLLDLRFARHEGGLAQLELRDPHEADPDLGLAVLELGLRLADRLLARLERCELCKSRLELGLPACDLCLRLLRRRFPLVDLRLAGDEGGLALLELRDPLQAHPEL